MRRNSCPRSTTGRRGLWNRTARGMRVRGLVDDLLVLGRILRVKNLLNGPFDLVLFFFLGYGEFLDQEISGLVKKLPFAQ